MQLQISRATYATFLLFLSASSFGQKSYQISGDSSYKVWFGSSIQTKKTDKVTSLQPKAIKLTDEKGKALYLLATRPDGKMAAIVLGESTPTIAITNEQFDRWYETNIIFSHSRKPVSAGVVTISCGTESWQLILTPQDSGKLIINGALARPIKITFTGKDLEGTAVKESSQFDLTKSGGTPTWSLNVPISGEVDTLDVEEDSGKPDISADPDKSVSNDPQSNNSNSNRSGGAQVSSPNQGKTGSSKNDQQATTSSEAIKEVANGLTNATDTSKPGGFGFLTGLLGILVGVGTLVGIWLLSQKYRDQINPHLKQMGVQIQEPGAEPVQLATTATDLPQSPPQAIQVTNAPLQPIQLPDVQSSVPTINLTPNIDVPKILVLKSDNRADIAVTEGLFAIGRDLPAPFGISDNSVSRQHAELKNEDGVVTVTDYNSTNGTFVNGERISDNVILQVGDLVQFGQISYRVERG